MAQTCGGLKVTRVGLLASGAAAAAPFSRFCFGRFSFSALRLAAAPFGRTGSAFPQVCLLCAPAQSPQRNASAT